MPRANKRKAAAISCSDLRSRSRSSGSGSGDAGAAIKAEITKWLVEEEGKQPNVEDEER